jgi:hypothetical protein
VQFRLRAECDGGSGQNGAFKNAVGAKGGGSAESPYDVLRFGPVDQDEIAVCGGYQGAPSLEEKHGVRVAFPVQSDRRAQGEVDGATGPVGSGRESFSSDFDCQILLGGSSG